MTPAPVPVGIIVTIMTMVVIGNMGMGMGMGMEIPILILIVATIAKAITVEKAMATRLRDAHVSGTTVKDITTMEMAISPTFLRV